MKLRSISGLGLALGVVAVAGSALAQPLYKNVMPDGRVIYADKPLPGAQESRALDVPPPPSQAERDAALKRAEAEKRKRTELEGRIEERRKAFDEADARVAKARKALEDARAALETGRDPQPGEMRANVGGGARPSEEYLKRIADLERNVESAQKELDDALRARNAAR